MRGCCHEQKGLDIFCNSRRPGADIRHAYYQADMGVLMAGWNDDTKKRDDPVMQEAERQTDEWEPRAILTIVIPVLLIIACCMFFSWVYLSVGLPDLETIRATAEALP
jgi:hypothetical protein